MPETEEDKTSENSLGPATSESFAQCGSPDGLINIKDNSSNTRQIESSARSNRHYNEEFAEEQLATATEKLELGDKTLK